MAPHSKLRSQLSLLAIVTRTHPNRTGGGGQPPSILQIQGSMSWERAGPNSVHISLDLAVLSWPPSCTSLLSFSYLSFTALADAGPPSFKLSLLIGYL
ncbi:hypothetical protein VTK26DRAFT_5639 [Humicola hyalothermophila]